MTFSRTSIQINEAIINIVWWEIIRPFASCACSSRHACAVMSCGQNNKGLVLLKDYKHEQGVLEYRCEELLSPWTTTERELARARAIYITLWDMYKIGTPHLFLFTCKYSPRSLLNTWYSTSTPGTYTQEEWVYWKCVLICCGSAERQVKRTSPFGEMFAANLRQLFALEKKCGQCW